MLNSVKAKTKKSKVERVMNQLIIIVFLIQVLLCLVAAIYYSAWYSDNEVNQFMKSSNS